MSRIQFLAQELLHAVGCGQKILYKKQKPCCLCVAYSCVDIWRCCLSTFRITQIEWSLSKIRMSCLGKVRMRFRRSGWTVCVLWSFLAMRCSLPSVLGFSLCTLERDLSEPTCHWLDQGFLPAMSLLLRGSYQLKIDIIMCSKSWLYIFIPGTDLSFPELSGRVVLSGFFALLL